MIKEEVFFCSEESNLGRMPFEPQNGIMCGVGADGGLPDCIPKGFVVAECDDVPQPLTPGTLEVVVRYFPIDPAVVILGSKEFRSKMVLTAPVYKMIAGGGVTSAGERSYRNILHSVG